MTASANCSATPRRRASPNRSRPRRAISDGPSAMRDGVDDDADRARRRGPLPDAPARARRERLRAQPAALPPGPAQPHPPPRAPGGGLRRARGDALPRHRAGRGADARARRASRASARTCAGSSPTAAASCSPSCAIGGAEPHEGRDGVAFAAWEDEEGRSPQEVPLPPDLPARVPAPASELCGDRPRKTDGADRTRVGALYVRWRTTRAARARAARRAARRGAGARGAGARGARRPSVAHSSASHVVAARATWIQTSSAGSSS